MGSTFHHGSLRDIAPLPEEPAAQPALGATTNANIVMFTVPAGAPAQRSIAATLGAPFGPRFGRILPEGTKPLSAEALAVLALALSSDAETDATRTPESTPDGEENTDIDAGYTYLGQFIDHDLTFDPVSNIDDPKKPEDVTNFRTPRLDLDSMYGSGPGDQPFLYVDGVRLAQGALLDQELEARDLPRMPKNPDPPAPGAKKREQRAVIGDPRNDENRIISQFHATMIQFHNKVVDAIDTGAMASDDLFLAAQRWVRWHYQYIVVNDFLKTIVDPTIVDDVLAHKSKLFETTERVFIPIEFAGASYRFGHSMVRPLYRLNAKHDDSTRLENRIPIFPAAVDPALEAEKDAGSLLGFRANCPDLAVDWRYFFRLDAAIDPTVLDPKLPSRQQRLADRPKLPPLQKAYKIDTAISFPMTALPAQVLSKRKGSIASANLQRSNQFSLASVQQAFVEFAALGIAIEPDLRDNLRVGKAEKSYDDPALPSLTEAILSKLPPADVDRAKTLADEIAAATPLWYYGFLEAQSSFKARPVDFTIDNQIMKIVQNDGAPIRLRGIGGRIVAEVLIGLLRADPTSYLGQEATEKWTPAEAGSPFAKTPFVNPTFGILDLIRIARPYYQGFDATP